MTLTIHHYRYAFLTIRIEADDEQSAWAGVADACRTLRWQQEQIWIEEGVE